MIKIYLSDSIIRISGHAGYADMGKDIVCAGVTALVQTLIKSIEDLTTDKIKYEILPGKACIKFRNLSKETKLLINSFFKGAELIADEFPGYVVLSRRGGL